MRNLSLVFLAFFAGCATNPKAVMTAESGKWDAKVMIKDKVHEKSQVVLAEIIAERPQSLRMDFHTSLGNSLASFAIAEGKMSYWVPSQRKYYSGPISPEAFEGLLKTRVNPSWIIRALFEKDLEKDGWTCGRDGSGILLQCRKEDPSGPSAPGESLKFLSREGTRRVVEYEGASILVKLSLQGQTLNEKYPDKMFFIAKP
ncbi:MAG: hypothetical protein K2X47_08085 [Bdellovibrionales bacterium]|nr:hypothetical protein [Bdellovibrionales bacterium]